MPTPPPWTLLACEWLHAGPIRGEGRERASPWTLRSRVEELGRVGFTGIGLQQFGLAQALEREAEGATLQQKLAWLKRLLDDNGLTAVELECLVSWHRPRDSAERAAEQEMRDLLMASAGPLGAHHIKAVKIDETVLPLDELREAFTELCEEAGRAGTRIAMELLPPDPHCRTLADALEWAGGQRHGGLFLDVWHVNNLPGVSYADIAALPPGVIVGAEINDGFAFDEDDQQSLAQAGMGFRQLTGMRRIAGEGDFDIEGFIRAVAATGYDGPWGHEVLSDELRRLPMRVAYRRAYRGAAALLDRALGGA